MKKLAKSPSPHMFQGAYKKTARVLSFILMWVFLPIILNLFSIFTKFLGLTYLSNLLFGLRYRSLFLLPIIIVFYFIAKHCIKKKFPNFLRNNKKTDG
jgi:hypothetical protein